MPPERLPHDEKFLREKLNGQPGDWDTRKRLAHALYDRDAFAEAAELIWTAEQIPSTDLELAFAARILAKAQPRRAIRLLAAVLELNRGKAVQNMGMANALLHHGMVLQAARFYGAALEADPSLVNPDLEHFIMWTDDEMRLWADFADRRPKLGDLPWMARDPVEALRLTQRIKLHTSPIHVPNLPRVPGEDLRHDLYEQEAARNAKITPPPAVTIPIDRVDPKHRLYDATYGATAVGSDAPLAAPEAEPIPEINWPKHAPLKMPSAVAIPEVIPIPKTPDRVVPPTPRVVATAPVTVRPPTPSTVSPAAPGSLVPAATRPPALSPAQMGAPTGRLISGGVKPGSPLFTPPNGAETRPAATKLRIPKK